VKSNGQLIAFFMKIKFSEKHKKALALKFQKELEIEISELQMNILIECAVEELSSTIYARAIKDTEAYIRKHLEDLQGDLYQE